MMRRPRSSPPFPYPTLSRFISRTDWIPAPPQTAFTRTGPEGSHGRTRRRSPVRLRSEEHTSELQSRQYLVCRLLLEKKKKEPSLSLPSSRTTQHTLPHAVTI